MGSMTEREADCIRAMLNFLRGGVSSWVELRNRMRADGWVDDEIHAALSAINPPVSLPKQGKTKP